VSHALIAARGRLFSRLRGFSALGPGLSLDTRAAGGGRGALTGLLLPFIFFSVAVLGSTFFPAAGPDVAPGCSASATPPIKSDAPMQSVRKARKAIRRSL
jgi:hypothetical protein